MKQDEFAPLLGVTRNYLSQIETGRMPSDDVVERFKKIERQHAIKERALDEDERDQSTNVVREERNLTPRALLKEARQRKGMSVKDICKATGYSELVWRNIEDGSAQMGEKMIPRVAKALNLDPEILMSGSDHPPENGVHRGTFGTVPRIEMPPGMKAKFVPLITMAQAGGDVEWTDEGYNREGVIAFDPKDKDAFGVEISGESMMPRHAPGDVAIVYPNFKPQNGDLVIAVLEKRGDVMFKLYHRSGTRVTLTSYNPHFPPLEYDESEFRKLFPVASVTSMTRRFL